MKIQTVLDTKGGRRERKRFSEMHGPSNDEQHVYSPDGAIKVYCSTDEMEEFERDSETKIDSDVLEARQFIKFVAWMQLDCGLKLSGVFEK